MGKKWTLLLLWQSRRCCSVLLERLEHYQTELRESLVGRGILEAVLEAEAGVAFQAATEEGRQICQSFLQYIEIYMSCSLLAMFRSNLFVPYSTVKQSQQNAGVDG